MFEFFKTLFRKPEVIEHKKRIVVYKYYFPYAALVRGGDVAHDYFIKELIDYIYQNTGVDINPSDVSYCNDDRWRYIHNGADVINVYFDNVNVDERTVNDIVEFADDFLNRFAILHGEEHIVCPTDIQVEDLDDIGTVSGYIHFADLPSFKDYKTIRPEHVSTYMKFVQERANEMLELDDVDRMRKFCKHYRFKLEIDSDRGFKWLITFLEVEPINLSADLNGAISKIADNLICDEYFIPKL